MPVAGLQVPGSWHWSAVQTTGLAPKQLPFWQLSVCVQALPSLQAVPLVLFVGTEHMPVAALQVPGSWHWSAVQNTGLAPMQLPFWQVSVCVQALPSLQAVPLVLVVGAEHTPVAALQVPGSWHWFAVQTTGLAPMQLPFWQVSVCVQALPSLQAVPLVLVVGTEHTPVAGLRVPGSWHWSAGQTTGFAPTLLPFWQVSVCVQALPSLQAVPLVLLVGTEHTPVAGLQVPGSWHWSAVQTTGFAPTQLPFWQVSVCVQASPSLQAVPLVLVVGAEHMPVAGLQVPGSWHWSAVQTTGLAPTQLPFWQVSVCVQALPSLQAVLLVLFVGAEHTPVAGLQVPGSWHWFAVQTTGLAPTQLPFWHVSVCVQALPSLQVALLVALPGSEHTPVAGLQVPGSWHWFAVQTTGLAPTQLPFWQVSVCVQASLPVALALLVLFVGAEHTPVAGLQVPGSWHWSAVQTTGLA